MTDFCRAYTGATHVPDPYYEGAEGFERVLELLEDACGGLFESLRSEEYCRRIPLLWRGAPKGRGGY